MVTASPRPVLEVEDRYDYLVKGMISPFDRKCKEACSKIGGTYIKEKDEGKTLVTCFANPEKLQTQCKNFCTNDCKLKYLKYVSEFGTVRCECIGK